MKGDKVKLQVQERNINLKKILSFLNSPFRFIHSSLPTGRQAIHPFKHSSIHPFTSFILILLLFSSCSYEKIIEQNKFVLIYSDLLIAQDTLSINEKEADSLMLSVYKKYNVTKTDYENTIEYYNKDIERWEEFFDKVTVHIKNLSNPFPKERTF